MYGKRGQMHVMLGSEPLEEVDCVPGVACLS